MTSENLSNEELRLKIAKLKGKVQGNPRGNWSLHDPDTGETWIMFDRGCEPAYIGYQKHYCPNWPESIADAWALVEEAGLSLVNSEDGWYAVKAHDIIHGNVRGTDSSTITLELPEGEHDVAVDANPARAICLAWLSAHQKGGRGE